MTHDTPRTDRNERTILGGVGGDWKVVLSDFARMLEREGNTARAEIEAMREVVAAAEKCRHWHDCSYNPATGKTEGVIISAVSFWELRAALAKLQPFLKP